MCSAMMPAPKTNRTRDRIHWLALALSTQKPGRVRSTPGQPFDRLAMLDICELDSSSLTRAEGKERVRQNLEGFVERQKLRNQKRAAMLEATRDDRAVYQKAYREANKGNR